MGDCMDKIDEIKCTDMCAFYQDLLTSYDRRRLLLRHILMKPTATALQHATDLVSSEYTAGESKNKDGPFNATLLKIRYDIKTLLKLGCIFKNKRSGYSVNDCLIQAINQDIYTTLLDLG